MNLIKTKIDDLVILKPTIIKDNRGYFMECFNQKDINNLLGDISFIQDNESQSSRGVLRGLHFQKPPFDQAKLVRCIKGRVLDVAVDIRKKSQTYGKSIALELSEENKRQLFIPRGFAHGFLVLSETAIFAYKVDNFYAPKYDAGLNWNDPKLNIKWNVDKNEVIVSEKDSKLPFFSEFKTPFENKI